MNSLIFLVLCLLPRAFDECAAVDCLNCVDTEVSCNNTTCVVQHCSDVIECTGSCSLHVSTSSLGVSTGFATCIPQEGDLSTIYRDDNLNSSCIQSNEEITAYYDNSSLFSCVCQASFCNEKLRRMVKDTGDTDSENENVDSDATTTIVSGCAAGLIVITIVIIVAYMLIVRQRRKREDDEKKAMADSGPGQNRFSADDSSLLEGGWEEIGKHSCSTYKYSTSMSSHYSRGSKGNALNQNDQHLPIELDKIIGRGRFAEVWKAKLQQDSRNSKMVSVKVFRLPNYGAWRQEKEILSERWMSHDNIIEFYASEQHSVRGRLQYWLITAYYQKGNLQEFLCNNVLKWNEFCDLSASIAKGLAYLHDEHDVNGAEKFPVAHRDVKSCNILVKDDGVSCVLADFGLSLKLDPSLSRDELANAGQVGTSRYMAPELLERLVNLADIEMFKRVDIYAFSLVMWELVSRCDVIEGMVRPYQPPFGEVISDHPTKEQMLLLVCRSKQRPEIRREWKAHKGLCKYVETMTECWDSEPESRITSSCAYERILALRKDDVIVDDVVLSPKEAEAKEAIANNEVNEMTELISTVV